MDSSTKILIVEDEILIADYILQILQDNHFKNINTANTYKDAELKISKWSPDIILMDINLEGKQDGIVLSSKEKLGASVIFLTGQLDRASTQKALLTNPEAYLTKPIRKHDLLTAVELCVLKKQPKTYTFKDGYDTVNLNYNEILYLSVDGNYLNIHTSNKKFTIRKTLSSALNELPNTIFKQTHRSFAVNIQKITRRSSTKIFINSIEIPISRLHDKTLKNTV